MANTPCSLLVAPTSCDGWALPRRTCQKRAFSETRGELSSAEKPHQVLSVSVSDTGYLMVCCLSRPECVRSLHSPLIISAQSKAKSYGNDDFSLSSALCLLPIMRTIQRLLSLAMPCALHVQSVAGSCDA